MKYYRLDLKYLLIGLLAALLLIIVGLAEGQQRDAYVIVIPATHQPQVGSYLPVWCVNGGVVTTTLRCTVLASFTQVPRWKIPGRHPGQVAWMEIQFDALTWLSLTNPTLFIGLQHVLVLPLPGRSGGWIKIPDHRALIGVWFYLQAVVHEPFTESPVAGPIVIRGGSR